MNAWMFPYPLLALDTGPESGSIAGEIISRVSTNCFDALKQAPKRLTLPDIPTPTSLALTKVFYKRAEDIANVAGSMLGEDFDTSALHKRSENFPMMYRVTGLRGHSKVIS